jgi:formate-nitrite transporter family protein
LIQHNISTSAGGQPKLQDSGALDEKEQWQAVEHSAIRALVIHEVLRAEGEEELKRRPMALAWCGLAAGMSMRFFLLITVPCSKWRSAGDLEPSGR